MKNLFLIFGFVFAFYKVSYSQYTGGPYDGYYSKLDTNVEHPSGINSNEIILEDFFLSQNYPNPFNPVTIINYSVPVNSNRQIQNIKLIVYDVAGKQIRTLVDTKQTAGSYSVEFDGKNLPSGIYFYELRTENFSQTRKMILIK